MVEYVKYNVHKLAHWFVDLGLILFGSHLCTYFLEEDAETSWRPSKTTIAKWTREVGIKFFNISLKIILRQHTEGLVSIRKSNCQQVHTFK